MPKRESRAKQKWMTSDILQKMERRRVAKLSVDEYNNNNNIDLTLSYYIFIYSEVHRVTIYLIEISKQKWMTSDILQKMERRRVAKLSVDEYNNNNNIDLTLSYYIFLNSEVHRVTIYLIEISNI